MKHFQIFLKSAKKNIFKLMFSFLCHFSLYDATENVGIRNKTESLADDSSFYSFDSSF